MKRSITILILIAAALTMSSCGGNGKKEMIAEDTARAEQQTTYMLDILGEPTGNNMPRTTNKEGKTTTTRMNEWTSGFFPGTLWYLYELTGKEEWRTEAEKWTWSIEDNKFYTGNHDIGFLMMCSFGNAERLAPGPKYNDILIQSAESALKRYNDTVQSIKSWNGRRYWHGQDVMNFPVIIDNMMNLELLFYATKVSGDPKYREVAIKHANTTMKHHFREDYSTYHVLDYDTETGELKGTDTHQGYSNNSTWARGQAWAIYGYTMTYRETGDPEYLKTAEGAAKYYLDNLPSDMIPLWDFNVDMEGYTPEGKSYAVEFREKLKDTSAAAITCSALFELYELTGKPHYGEAAVKTLKALSSPEYLAEAGTNGGFIIKHSVGSIPHRSEIDVPLVYTDYYFMEALVRYKNSDLK